MLIDARSRSRAFLEPPGRGELLAREDPRQDFRARVSTKPRLVVEKFDYRESTRRPVIPPSESKVERRQEVPHAASLTMKHSRGDFSCLAASALQGFAEISRDK